MKDIIVRGIRMCNNCAQTGGKKDSWRSDESEYVNILVFLATRQLKPHFNDLAQSTPLTLCVYSRICDALELSL